ELERLQAENRRLTEIAQAQFKPSPQPQPQFQPPPEPVNAAEFDRQVQERVDRTILNDRANQLDNSLKTDFAEDYETVIGNFQNVSNSMRVMFEDIVATGEGPYVAITIGKDPARIQQLRDMPAAQRRMASLRVAMDKPKATGEPQPPIVNRPSAAPPPP